MSRHSMRRSSGAGLLGARCAGRPVVADREELVTTAGGPLSLTMMLALTVTGRASAAGVIGTSQVDWR